MTASRLIATQFRPRNPALAEAMRVLGLAEREGVGIDTIYRVMLRDGHPDPEITEQDGEVVVRLSGGPPDTRLREYLDDVARRQPLLREDVRATIAITTLLMTSVLRPQVLADVAQASIADAADILDRLEKARVVGRLLNQSRSYRLTQHARDALGDRVRYGRRTVLEQHADLVDAYLDTHADIGREQAIPLLRVGPTRASQVLKQLADAGHLVRVGPARGRLVRFRRP